jgi:membrane-associated phospholipid phosphatase
MKATNKPMSFKLLFLVICVSISYLTVNAQSYDVDLLRKINHSYTEPTGNVMWVISESITPVAIATPLSVFALAWIKKDRKIALKGLEIASAEIISSLITSPLKLGLKRERPFVTHNDINKYSTGGSYSFPSGHTSMAFATATSLSLVCPKWYVIVPSFTYASLMGYSRMYLGVHYPSDVLIGAIIGSGSAYLSHYLYEKFTKDKTISPTVNLY